MSRRTLTVMIPLVSGAASVGCSATSPVQPSVPRGVEANLQLQSAHSGARQIV